MSISFNFISQFDVSLASFRSRVQRLYDYVSTKRKCGLNDDNESYDVVVIQKGDFQFVYNQFIKYKKLKKFIVLDIDDYCDNTNKFFIRYADLVIVGSSFLQHKWKNLNKNIVVLDDPLDVYDKNIPLKKSDTFYPDKLGWFGNRINLDILRATHIPNVKTITRDGDIEWAPDSVDKNIQRFDLIVLPQDTHSNYGAAKGNCRMMKALYLGVPVLCSDLPAYVDLADLLGYPHEMIMHDGEDWNQRISDIKNGVIAPRFDFDKYRKIILDNYSTQTRGQQWLDIVEQYYQHRHRHILKNILFNLVTLKSFEKIRDGNKRTIIILGFIKIKYTKRTKNG